MLTLRFPKIVGPVTLGLALLVACAGCGKGEGPAPRINAGGATFVNPIMQKWSAEYNKAKKVEIDYVSKGSGYGIEQVTAKTIDFGCSDAPMKADQVAAAKQKGGDVVHIPLAMGAVAVAYNVPTLNSPLKLTGEVIADIFSKKITKWNDAKIAALNAGVALPDKDIMVVVRAESSGTSNIFTEYLSKSSAAFKMDIGTNTKPKWPEGTTGQQGSDGVAGFVKANEGTICYVEVLFAKKNQLGVAVIKNKAGKFIGPDADAVTAAADEAMKVKPADEPYSLHELTYSLTNADGEASYAIGGISYAILFAKLPKDKGPTIVAFLKWAVSDGQAFAKDMDYAPLPADLQKKAMERLAGVTFE